MILSDSGKPIFARYGSDEQVGQMCSVIQGLRAAVLYDTSDDLPWGDVQSVQSDNLLLVLWQVKALTFVAICSRALLAPPPPTEAYLRFVLETLYCQLVFSLTQPVLDSMMLYPNFDIQSVMGRTTERQLHTLLDQMENLESSREDSPCSLLPLGLVHSLGGALQPLHPLLLSVREQASQALREIGDKTPDTLFAFLFVPDGRLVSLVQSALRTMQMKAADWSLLLHFIGQQTELTASELWLPVCLPRFNASGYVYCYTCCLDTETGLCIGLVSHIGTTDQFRLFQQAVGQICCKLSISGPHNKQMFPQKRDEKSHDKLPIINKRKDSDDGSDQDYVDASGDGDRMIPYVAADGLVEEVARALDETVVSKLHGQYLQICQAFHFVFRYDVALPRASFRQSTPGRLPQCVCTRHPEHFPSAASRQTLWSTYDKLMMRLRLGSAQSESVQDALKMIARDNDKNSNGGSSNTEPPAHAAVEHTCHVMKLLEVAPDFAGMTSVCQGDYLYVGINGEAFELYFTVSSQVSVKQATAMGARLVRRLFIDQQKLFLWNPFVWKK